MAKHACSTMIECWWLWDLLPFHSLSCTIACMPYYSFLQHPSSPSLLYSSTCLTHWSCVKQSEKFKEIFKYKEGLWPLSVLGINSYQLIHMGAEPCPGKINWNLPTIGSSNVLACQSLVGDSTASKLPGEPQGPWKKINLEGGNSGLADWVWTKAPGVLWNFWKGGWWYKMNSECCLVSYCHFTAPSVCSLRGETHALREPSVRTLQVLTCLPLTCLKQCWCISIPRPSPKTGSPRCGKGLGVGGRSTCNHAKCQGHSTVTSILKTWV